MTDTSPDAAEPTLLPCPHCGAPANLEEYGYGAWEAICSAGCGAGTLHPRDKAIAMWNRRATPPGLEAVRAAALDEAAFAADQLIPGHDYGFGKDDLWTAYVQSRRDAVTAIKALPRGGDRDQTGRTQAGKTFGVTYRGAGSQDAQ